MSTEAKILLDSISPNGDRLTTFVVKFHRFVLSEFNTHRVFSRSSASSRAIPVERQLEMLIADPAFPIKWAVEQKGMQGGDELEGLDLLDAENLFKDVYNHTMRSIENYFKDHPDKSSRLHKSLVNRLLEPFMWHTVICSSTEWDNFFNQRVSPLAQPEINAVATLMKEAYEASTPTFVGMGEWHTPFIQENERHFSEATRLRISTARSARVSYLNHDGQRDLEADEKLFQRLVTADPPHWAPLEMVATPADNEERTLGNFDGWHQLRHRQDIVQAII